MLPQEQQQLRNDELTEKMEAMRFQLKQLQEDRERAQKIQRGTEDASVADVNKCPLLEVAVNDAFTVGNQVIDKPMITKDSTIRDKLTSHLHAFDTKLKIDSRDQSAMISTTHRTKTFNARMVRVAPYTTNKAQSKTFQDALAYVEKVKVTSADQPEVYKTFLSLLQGYKNGTISFTNIITKIKQLFRGHPELMNGFIAFVAPSYNMNSPTLHAKLIPPIISYYMRRSQNEPEKSRSFLKNLLTFSEKVHDQVSNNDVVLAEEEVMREIIKLFKKKQDLAIESAQNVDHFRKEN